MHLTPRNVRFIITCAVLSLLCTALVALEGLLPDFKDRPHLIWFLTRLPYVAFPAAGLLALRLNQVRQLCICLMWTAAYALMRLWPETGSGAVDAVSLAGVLAASIPLSTVVMLLLPAGNAGGIYWLLYALVALGPLGVLTWLVAAGPQTVARLFLFFPSDCAAWWQLPLPAMALALLSALLLLLRARREVFYFALAGIAAIVPLLSGLGRHSAMRCSGLATDAAPLAFAASAAFMAYAVYRSYWEHAYIDELTGILNRRALNERLYRLGKTFSIAMLDVDFFKGFNDSFGHAQGDTALRFVAAHLDRTFPGCAYRYGGEEFCVLFDGVPLRLAARRLEGARHLIQSRTFYIRMPEQARQRTNSEDRGERIGSSTTVHISLSAGVAYRASPSEQVQDILDMADQALYAAKSAGRARVCCYGEG